MPEGRLDLCGGRAAVSLGTRSPRSAPDIRTWIGNWNDDPKPFVWRPPKRSSTPRAIPTASSGAGHWGSRAIVRGELAARPGQDLRPYIRRPGEPTVE